MRGQSEMEEFNRQLDQVNEFGYVPRGPNESTPVNLATSRFGKKFDFERSLEQST